MIYAPVVLFVYKRLEETQRVLDALAANEGASQSHLIVFADGPKSAEETAACEAVRQLIRNTAGFDKVTLYEAEKNKGLANSVIDGVSRVLEEYDRIIVVEDDLVTSKYFLRFMNEALEKYENDERICCIHSFCCPSKQKHIPYFLRRGADCWGWATWKRGWKIFSADAQYLYDQIIATKQQKEFDQNDAFPYTRMLKDQAEGKIDSWAVRWYASAFLAEKYTLQSNVMLSENIGFGKNATHVKFGRNYHISLSEEPVIFDREPDFENDYSKSNYRKFLKKSQVSFWKKITTKIFSILIAFSGENKK